MEYRILQEGEIIQEDDEVDISQHLNEEPVWVKTTCAGQKAPNPLCPAHRVYRRLVDAAKDGSEKTVVSKFKNGKLVSECVISPRSEHNKEITHGINFQTGLPELRLWLYDKASW